MSDFSIDNDSMIFGFSKNSCHLCFHKKPLQPYIPNSNDFYWKIGITLKNIDKAVDYLRKQNIQYFLL